MSAKFQQASSTIPLESQQIFALIDSILPLEICLHYQILPLCLKDNNLYLGVVDSEDESALEYVQKIVSYMNCSIIIQVISFEEQRSLLSSYLYHTQQAQGLRNSTTDVEVTSSLELEAPPEISVPNSEVSPPVPVIPRKIREDSSVSLSSLAGKFSVSAELTSPSFLKPLEIKTAYLESPIEVLAMLSPQDLLQELLGRVLVGGIGRLYFERQEGNLSRILWSQDGVLQSVVTGLEQEQFQGVINELKKLVELPLVPIDKPQQVEIERTYQDTHLLLRLRISPGALGEEANLQVLRGAALKFHQKQQLSKLSLDTLRLAQQLQYKLVEINARLAIAPLSSENLVLLNQLLKTMVQQSDALIQRSQGLDTNH